ncbi:MAG: 50S ribosomal protein L29 [Elusimicrobia bacterium]|nr:50S ribosomal protein L29 [Elusimicrobiota bacterium]
MKTKEKETFRNMSEGEIKASIKDLEKKLFQLKFKKASSPLENPIEIRLIRRKIAFLKTLISQRKKAVSAK